jgi:NodT family efflux transporter outer membrane factor (OMF) lipoprotein
MSRIRATFAVLPALALAACAVGPNYKPPVVQPDAKQPFAEGQASTMLSGQPLPANWWEMFQDPALDRLIRDAFAYNTDIRIADANLRQARGVVLQQRAGLFPTTTVSGQYSRNRTGVDSLAAQGGAAEAGAIPPGVDGFNYNLFQAGFDASYEVDVFGRVRRSIEAARGDEQASAAQLDAARITIAASVAQAYADACGYAAQADVARDTARLQGDTLKLTQRLLDAGRGTRRDVDQAAVTVEQANAQVPQLEAERRAQLYALAALTGRPPAEIDGEAQACHIVPKVKTVIPVGDGATLLARRPDVRAAERTLAADTARIGVATAALFPSVSLMGSVNSTGTKGSQLGTAKSFGFSVGPLIQWNFPNILAARAQIKQAKAGTDASLASFQGTVLTALKETEQALARYAASLDQNAALGRAADAADDAAKLSRIRFDTGRDNFLNLLVSEQNRAAARAALAQSDQQVADAQVSLFKALGGGWENAPPIANAAPAAASGNPSVQRGSFAVPVSQKSN